MRHLAAFLLLVSGGNTAPTAADVTTLLEKSGVEVDTDRLNTLIKDLEGKDLDEIIELGSKQLITVPTGGGGAAPAVAATEDAPAAAVAAPKEEEVDALEGGMDMFGGGGGDY